MRRYQVPFVASLFVLASLACGSYSRSSEQIIHTATAPVAAATAPAPATSILVTATAETAPVPATSVPVTYLGDQVELDGYSLSALTVEDPATRPGVFYEPQPGKKLIAVEFVTGNVAGELYTSNVLNATLVDTDGFLYRAENTGVEGEIALLDVNPGERVQGWASFFIPESAQAAALKYKTKGVELAVGLLPRP